MFLGVKCWREGELARERLREVSASLKLPISLVEREIIFYDTLEAMCTYTPSLVMLKGGTLISRLYSEQPRFSWDIDFSAPLQAKPEYDLKAMKRRMVAAGRVAELRLGTQRIKLGEVKRDVEKDVFEDLLSLKRDMLTWSLGAPLPTYLRGLGWNTRALRRELLQLKQRIGCLPSVDAVRATVSLRTQIFKTKRRIPSLLDPVLPPRRKVVARVCPPELCVLEKLSRLSKGVEEIGTRDLLCDFYDLGQLLRLELGEETLTEIYHRMYVSRKLPSPLLLRRKLAENLSIVKRSLDAFEKRREFVWCRYRWKSYFSETVRKIKRVLRYVEVMRDVEGLGDARNRV